MWEDYVYDKNKKGIRIGKKGDQNDSSVIYLGRFLNWEEANDYFKECKIEKIGGVNYAYPHDRTRI